MITIDELRKICKQIVYHPLGAIRITVKTSGKDAIKSVYHFYSDQSPMLNTENYHSHPYSFTSTILKGTLKQIIYDYEESTKPTDYRLMQRACCKNAELSTVYDNVAFSHALTFDTQATDSYTIDCKVMHKIGLGTPKVVSLLRKGPVVHEPRFIVKKGVHFTEEQLFPPWSPNKCWEIVEYTLNDD